MNVIPGMESIGKFGAKASGTTMAVVLTLTLLLALQAFLRWCFSVTDHVRSRNA